jgi:CheY-like chemotaxis protein
VVSPDPKSSPDGTGGSQGGALIFVSDASAEAERLSAALRTRGYWVVDVPLGLLAGRVAVQRPSLVVLDADTPGTTEAVQRMQAAGGEKPIDVVLIADASQSSPESRSELEQRAVGFFTRPINVEELTAKIAELVGPPGHRSDAPSGPAARSPVLVAATRRPYRYEGGKARPLSGAPPPGPNLPGAPPSIPAAAATSPSQAPSGPPPSTGRPSSLPPGGRMGSVVPQAIGAVPHARLSPELELLLGRAEQRVRNIVNVPQPVERLSPDAEVDAVLPADLLAALDEPIQADDDDDDDDSVAGTAGTGGGSDTGSRGSRGGTPAGGTASGGRTTNAQKDTTGAPGSRADAAPPPPEPEPSAPEFGNEAPTLPPARPLPSQPLSGRTGTALESIEPVFDSNPSRVQLPSEPPPPPPSRPEETISTRPPRAEPPPTAPGNSIPERPPAYPNPSPPSAPAPSRGGLPDIPVSLGPGGGLRALARCVAARYTGAIALEDSAGIRRVVFRDGDFVTAASSAENETLVAFLVQRGDLGSEGAQRVARRVPPFGRHAGAALVAQGHLRQDELWPVLRAHAEWLLGKIMDLASGAASLEREVPQRLQAEPGVFGGATGAEVLLEMIRRTVKPSEAIQQLGGRDAVLATGGARSLLAECALSEADQTLASQADGMTVGELVTRAGNEDFACVVLALVELGILLVQGTSKRQVAREPEAPPGWDPLDAEALRQRVAARRALVEEGDYFALLGVARDATSYDLRRAYQTLRKDLDPERVLTAATVDLRDDVDAILEVVDEAYDILRDPVRRERYKRALERAPD